MSPETQGLRPGLMNVALAGSSALRLCRWRFAVKGLLPWAECRPCGLDGDGDFDSGHGVWTMVMTLLGVMARCAAFARPCISPCGLDGSDGVPTMLTTLRARREIRWR